MNCLLFAMVKPPADDVSKISPLIDVDRSLLMLKVPAVLVRARLPSDAIQPVLNVTCNAVWAATVACLVAAELAATVMASVLLVRVTCEPVAVNALVMVMDSGPFDVNASCLHCTAFPVTVTLPDAMTVCEACAKLITPAVTSVLPARTMFLPDPVVVRSEFSARPLPVLEMDSVPDDDHAPVTATAPEATAVSAPDDIDAWSNVSVLAAVNVLESAIVRAPFMERSNMLPVVVVVRCESTLNVLPVLVSSMFPAATQVPVTVIDTALLADTVMTPEATEAWVNVAAPADESVLPVAIVSSPEADAKVRSPLVDVVISPSIKIVLEELVMVTDPASAVHVAVVVTASAFVAVTAICFDATV